MSEPNVIPGMNWLKVLLSFKENPIQFFDKMLKPFPVQLLENAQFTDGNE